MRQTKLPRHLQLREQLLRRWKEAGLTVGDRIESQNEILASCEFSLATVLKTLKDRGGPPYGKSRISGSAGYEEDAP